MRQKGFTLVEGVMIVVVLIIIGSLGYVFYTQMAKNASVSDETSGKEADTETVTAINSPSDLDTADKQLKAMDFDDSDDSKALDSQSADF